MANYVAILTLLSLYNFMLNCSELYPFQKSVSIERYPCTLGVCFSLLVQLLAHFQTHFVAIIMQYDLYISLLASATNSYTAHE